MCEQNFIGHWIKDFKKQSLIEDEKITKKHRNIITDTKMKKPNFNHLDPFTKKLAIMLINRKFIKTMVQEEEELRGMEYENAIEFIKDKPYFGVHRCSYFGSNSDNLEFSVSISIELFHKYFYEKLTIH